MYRALLELMAYHFIQLSTVIATFGAGYGWPAWNPFQLFLIKFQTQSSANKAGLYGDDSIYHLHRLTKSSASTQ